MTSHVVICVFSTAVKAAVLFFSCIKPDLKKKNTIKHPLHLGPQHFTVIRSIPVSSLCNRSPTLTFANRTVTEPAVP